MEQSDRPYYEELLEQRNALEKLIREMAKQMPPQGEQVWLNQLNEIVGPIRDCERLT